MKSNFNYIVVILIALVVALASFISLIFTKNINAEVWFDRSFWIGGISGLLMLLRNGTFIKTRYYKYLLGLISIIIIGALFKIMHWPFGNLTLSTGLICIIIVYFFSFLNKPIKKRLDFIKLIWVTISYSTSVLILFRIISKEYQILASAILWIMIIDYSISEYKKGTLFK